MPTMGMMALNKFYLHREVQDVMAYLDCDLAKAGWMNCT